jgi:hypothetical protein
VDVSSLVDHMSYSTVVSLLELVVVGSVPPVVSSTVLVFQLNNAHKMLYVICQH